MAVSFALARFSSIASRNTPVLVMTAEAQCRAALDYFFSKEWCDGGMSNIIPYR
jgi:hypothetical protein